MLTHHLHFLVTLLLHSFSHSFILQSSNFSFNFWRSFSFLDPSFKSCLFILKDLIKPYFCQDQSKMPINNKAIIKKMIIMGKRSSSYQTCSKVSVESCINLLWFRYIKKKPLSQIKVLLLVHFLIVLLSLYTKSSFHPFYWINFTVFPYCF